MTGAAVLLVYWLILFWMYRRKLFLKPRSRTRNSKLKHCSNLMKSAWKLATHWFRLSIKHKEGNFFRGSVLCGGISHCN